MIYVQGWAIGLDYSNDSAMLVPYELVSGLARGGVTVSGPVSADVRDSLNLAVWAVMLAIQDKYKPPEPISLHAHFPLRHVECTGVSARLSFAHAILQGYGIPTVCRAEDTALSGDLTLAGTVMPIEGASRKFDAFQRSELKTFITAKDEPALLCGAIRVGHLGELISNNP